MGRTTGVVVAAVVAMLAVESAALAQGAAPAGAHKTGVYVSAGLGLGGMTDSFDGSFGFVNGSASGASLGLDLAVGARIRPNLVVGGFAALDVVQEPDVEVNGMDVSNTISVGALFTIGGMVNWALRPEASGFHFRGGLGFSRLTVEDESSMNNDSTPSGLSFLLGAGYEWRVSPAWGVGAMLRVVSAFIDDDGISHSLFAGSLNLVFSYR